MQLVLLLAVLITLELSNKIFSEQKISLKQFMYEDSDNVTIRESIILYQTDLSYTSQLSAKYAIDSVTSASFNAVTGASMPYQENESKEQHKSVEANDKNEGNEGNEGNEADYSGASTKYRHSASLSLLNQWSSSIQTTTTLQGSSKSDYKSYTLGQSGTVQILSGTTIGLGGYYTSNDNNPWIPTTNIALLPPQNESLNSKKYSALVSLEQILSQKSKVAIIAEGFKSSGYLSSGYQRVPIVSGVQGGEALEVVPRIKNGVAITSILSHMLNPETSIHLRGRYYKDSYKIRAYSGDISFLRYLTNVTILRLKYRHYNQSEASFWGRQFNTLPTGYFTNHHALSKFKSNQATIGIWHEIDWDILSGTVSFQADHYRTDNAFKYTSISIGFEKEF